VNECTQRSFLKNVNFVSHRYYIPMKWKLSLEGFEIQTGADPTLQNHRITQMYHTLALRNVTKCDSISFIDYLKTGLYFITVGKSTQFVGIDW